MEKLKPLLLGPPRLKLAVAESVTCGRVQALAGAISGASEYFCGGITAYSLDGKVRHLGVDRAEAEAVNSVSGPIAEQMARGACELFDADIAVATTGYAEPSVEWRVTRPYAWWALAQRQTGGGFATRSGPVDCPGGSRVAVQELVATAAFEALVSWLERYRQGAT